jgi:hypothetical protein
MLCREDGKEWVVEWLSNFLRASCAEVFVD